MRVKKLKVNLDHLHFPNIKEIKDGTLGIAVEKALQEQGFNISNGTIDLPDYDLEIKTRKGEKGKSAHTVGTMTLQNIISTPWELSSFRQKLKSQFRVTFSLDTGKVCKQEIIHLNDDPHIEGECKLAYEGARQILTDHYNKTGKALEKYHIKGKFSEVAILEHKTGNSYAFRITAAAFKKFEKQVDRSSWFRAQFDYV